MKTQEQQKEQAAYAAIKLVSDRMKIGIGSGSTVRYFIKALSEKISKGLSIEYSVSSIASETLLSSYGIKGAQSTGMLLDLTIDGADEISPEGFLMKGGGGALTREKLLATSSKNLIIIADQSKKVDFLGKFPLAVEILPFFYTTTLKRLEDKGYSPNLRKTSLGEFFITDNGNYIADISNLYPIKDPRKLHEELKRIQGVVETGLFFDLPTTFIFGQ